MPNFPSLSILVSLTFAGSGLNSPATGSGILTGSLLSGTLNVNYYSNPSTLLDAFDVTLS